MGSTPLEYAEHFSSVRCRHRLAAALTVPSPQHWSQPRASARFLGLFCVWLAHRYILPTMVGVMMAKWVADAFGRDGLYEEAILFNGYPYLDNTIECAVARYRTASGDAVPLGLGRLSAALTGAALCNLRRFGLAASVVGDVVVSSVAWNVFPTVAHVCPMVRAKVQLHGEGGRRHVVVGPDGADDAWPHDRQLAPSPPRFAVRCAHPQRLRRGKHAQLHDKPKQHTTPIPATPQPILAGTRPPSIGAHGSAWSSGTRTDEFHNERRSGLRGLGSSSTVGNSEGLPASSGMGTECTNAPAGMPMVARQGLRPTGNAPLSAWC